MKFSKHIFVLVSISLSFLFLSNETLASQGNPNIYYVQEENTIYVRPTQDETETIVNLQDISDAINNESLIKEESPKVWLLSANLWLKGVSTAEKEITLQLTDETVAWLKLESNPSGFIWLKTYNGNFLIQNTKVTSWDTEVNAFDTDCSNGRSFVLAKYNSHMDITNSELSYLGYHSGESYGVSWRIAKGTLGQYLVTGIIEGSKFHHNYYGAYSFGAQNMVFRNNEFHHNIQYGLDPHDDSNNFLVEENTFYENGNHGLIFSKRCLNNVIRNNTSYNNDLSGIMLDKQSNNNIVENNIVFGNVNGIALYGSDSNIIQNNTVYQNKRGILSKDKSVLNNINSNEIYNNIQYGIYFYGGTAENTISNNEIYGNSKYGVYLKSPGNIVGPNNDIYSNDDYGISLYESEARDNIIKENQIYQNGKDGISVKNAGQNIIEKNEIYSNKKGSGIRIRQGLNNEIRNNNIHNNYYHGIYLYSASEKNKIFENDIHDNSNRGIYVKESNNNEVDNNSIKFNKSYGIYLYKNSSFNTVLNNLLEGNSRGIYVKLEANNNTLKRNFVNKNLGDGIYFSGSKENNINNNTAIGNRYGIYLYNGSNKNIVSGNIMENNDKGIYIKYSDDNNINQNSIRLSAEYPIYLYDSQNNIFIRNILSDNSRNYYYAKFRANNTIQNTNKMNVKVADNESSMNIIDTRNYIFENSKNIPTTAEPTKTSIILTRAITSSVVSFERLNFKVIPSANQIDVDPQVWETSPNYYKKWEESLPNMETNKLSAVMSSMSYKHTVGDLKPYTFYNVFVDGELWNSFTSNSVGIIHFLYNWEGSSKKIFEVIQND